METTDHHTQEIRNIYMLKTKQTTSLEDSSLPPTEITSGKTNQAT